MKDQMCEVMTWFVTVPYIYIDAQFETTSASNILPVLHRRRHVISMKFLAIQSRWLNNHAESATRFSFAYAIAKYLATDRQRTAVPSSDRTDRRVPSREN